MTRTCPPMTGKLIEQGPYDIDTPSYDIETGCYETSCSHTNVRPRKVTENPVGRTLVEACAIAVELSQPLRRFHAAQEALSRG